MWGVGACVSLQKPVILRRLTVSSGNSGSTTSASFPTPTAAPDLKPREQLKIEGRQQQKILGSDVVLALRRAAAEKNNNKKKMLITMKIKKKQQQRLTSSSDDIQNEEEVEAEVRPICINSDWTTRLDHLEKRLLLLSRSI